MNTWNNVKDTLTMPGPFDYMSMTDDQSRRSEMVREALHDAYEEIMNCVPASAERTLGLRRLEESAFWVNKAIVWDGQNTLEVTQRAAGSEPPA